MLLALALSSIKLVAANLATFSPGNGEVTCEAKQSKIENQTAINVSQSCTESIRFLVVCNTLRKIMSKNET